MAAPALSSTTDLTPASSIPLPTPLSQLESLYEISSTVQWIQQQAFTVIALQFPDELLHDSVHVFQALQAGLQSPSTELYILADTTFGSCCVDEIAAQHVNAQVVIHYGHACLSPTARLPVYYVFTRRPISLDHCVDALHSHLQSLLAKNFDTLLLRGDVSYDWVMPDLLERLREDVDMPVEWTARPRTRSAPADAASASSCESLGPANGGCCGASAECSKPTATPGSTCCSNTRPLPAGGQAAAVDAERLPARTALLWIGPSTLALTHLLMTNPSSTVISYEPDATGSTGTLAAAGSTTNKLLMRRYATIQKAADADVLGIVVGTLGIATYLPLVSQLRQLLRSRQKKVYTLSVGKPTPAKLANYQEVECFILIACPENSLLMLSPETSKEFYRPMVSPWEMRVALDGGWDQGWRLGWELQQELEADDQEQEGSGEDEVQFSAATGKLRTVRKYGKRQNAADLSKKLDSMQLQVRPDGLEVARLVGSAAGERLQGLTYKGLEVREGQDLPARIEQGRSGVARGYTHES